MRAYVLLVLLGCAAATQGSAPAWPHVWPKDGVTPAGAPPCTPGQRDDCTNGGCPLFCKGLDCPRFDVLETLPGNVELRSYHGKARWVATRVRDTTLFDAQVIGTKRLIAYFAGWNEDRIFLKPTLPLVTALFPEDRRSRSVKGTYVLLAYIPEDRQDRAPCPSDPDVHIITLRGRRFFVQTVDGFLDGSEVVARGWDLIERLRDERRCISRCVFGSAVYDPPTKLVWRHNEIWVPARRCGKGASGAGDAGGDDDWDDGAWPEAGDYDGQCSAADVDPQTLPQAQT